MGLTKAPSGRSSGRKSPRELRRLPSSAAREHFGCCSCTRAASDRWYFSNFSCTSFMSCSSICFLAFAKYILLQSPYAHNARKCRLQLLHATHNGPSSLCFYPSPSWGASQCLVITSGSNVDLSIQEKRLRVAGGRRGVITDKGQVYVCVI